MSELLDYVNDKGEVLGQCTYEEACTKKLRIRVVGVLVIDAQNRIILQLRNRSKKSDPRHFCVSAAGKVLAGESYVTAAKRELHEELNISDAEIKPLSEKIMFFEGEGSDRIAAMMFMAQVDSLKAVQNDEAEAIEAFAEGELSAMLNRFPYLFVNSLRDILHIYKPEVFKL